MNTAFSKRVTLPAWIFLASLLIHSLAPAPAKDFGWLLLMVAYVDTYFHAEGQGSILKKLTMTVSVLMKLLWVAGLMINLMR